MRIGFIINPTCSISGMGNGVLKQAAVWAEGLRSQGQEVEFIGPSDIGNIRALNEYDIVHFFQHGHWLKQFLNLDLDSRLWLFSPIVDSTASPTAYGLLARIPLRHYLVSFGPRVLRDFSRKANVLVRSQYERSIIEAVAPDSRINYMPIALSIRDGDHCRPKVDLPSEYALFVGGMFDGRKNVIRLIHACEELELPLVLVGNVRPTPYMNRLKEVIKKAKVPVFQLGFLDESELRWLYSNCSVFCLPSLIEGVGQVAMEALYFGARVVVTSIGGPVDYFGKLVDYVDPNSTREIADGLRSAMERSVDVVHAREHLMQYSPEVVGRDLLDCYNKV